MTYSGGQNNSYLVTTSGFSVTVHCAECVFPD